MNFNKYKPYAFAPVMDSRDWPSKTTTKAPRFVSVDLRDGNQALERPMNSETKLRFFKHLVKIGFKEIEVAYPSASQSDYDFVRLLIEEDHIPDDVTIQVLVPCIDELIEKTFQSLIGAKRVIIHLYNSTSKEQREQVFKMDKSQIKELALKGTKKVKEMSKGFSGKVRFQYSPESFSGTENEYALELCSEVINLWNPGSSDDDKIIINLPNTVESCPSNIYADRIEWISKRLPKRDRVIISVHAHNDRGSAVGATEMAMLAGATRVEGTLMGNGERSGNVDLVTLALNLLTQGIDPTLDLSDISELVNIVQDTTGIPVHVRHPYTGDYIFTAFSGTHQDAINKGITIRNQGLKDIWEVPYIPIDPKDLGLNYDNIIRINSQSGKGGISYILKTFNGYIVPKAMQADIRSMFKDITVDKEDTLSSDEIFNIFDNEFVNREDKLKLISYSEGVTRANTNFEIEIEYLGRIIKKSINNHGFLESAIGILSELSGSNLNIADYSEHSLGNKSDSMAITYIKLEDSGSGLSSWAVGRDSNIVTSSLKAVISAFNRLV